MFDSGVQELVLWQWGGTEVEQQEQCQGASYAYQKLRKRVLQSFKRNFDWMTDLFSALDLTGHSTPNITAAAPALSVGKESDIQ